MDTHRGYMRKDAGRETKGQTTENLEENREEDNYGKKYKTKRVQRGRSICGRN